MTETVWRKPVNRPVINCLAGKHLDADVVIIVITGFFIPTNVIASTDFQTYENPDYDIKMEYPAN